VVVEGAENIYIYKTLQKKLIFLSKNDVFEALHELHGTHHTHHQQASSGAIALTRHPNARRSDSRAELKRGCFGRHSSRGRRAGRDLGIGWDHRVGVN
jgi:hypothetical protein